MKKTFALCLFVLLISACAKENTDKESCATAPSAVYELIANLDGKAEKIGKIKITDCYIKIKNYEKVKWLGGFFAGRADENRNNLNIQLYVNSGNQVIVQNLFFENNCEFRIIYPTLDGRQEALPDNYACRKAEKK